MYLFCNFAGDVTLCTFVSLTETDRLRCHLYPRSERVCQLSALVLLVYSCVRLLSRVLLSDCPPCPLHQQVRFKGDMRLAVTKPLEQLAAVLIFTITVNTWCSIFSVRTLRSFQDGQRRTGPEALHGQDAVAEAQRKQNCEG